MAGAVAGLVAFLALMSNTGVQTLGWSMLAMSVVTCCGCSRGCGVRWAGPRGPMEPAQPALSTPGLPLRLRRAPADQPSAARGLPGARSAQLARDCGVVLGRTAIYLAFNVLFVITLAFASSSAAGGTTVLSYAYLFASYLVAGTGMALGMSSIPDMTREARTRRGELWWPPCPAASATRC